MSYKIFRMFFVLILVFSLTFTEFTPVLAAPPANDSFADTISIASLPFSTIVDTTDAGVEPGEPQPCNFTYATVWYSFTPAEDMVIRADVDGSAINSSLTIYRADGPGISGLTFWGCTGTGYTPSVLPIQAGQTYYLQVGSPSEDVGAIQINLEQVIQPLNDNFAQAEEIPSLPFNATIDNGAAGLELDEPQQCAGTYNTIWYSFTPAETMWVLADTQESTISVNINIYRATGSGITDLQAITCTRYYDGVFLAEAGATYYLQAGGQDPIVGTVQVNLKQVFAPANDDFASAEEITSLPFTSTVDISGASVESGEPSGCNSTERTVWYSFTPTETTLVGGDSLGTVIYNQVIVYTDSGSGLSGLTLLECLATGNAFSFTAQAGQTYYLQVGSNSVGTVQVNLKEIFPPANDNFASAEEITSLSYNVTVDITDARSEAGEPLYWCATGDRTVWYSFTSTETMIVRADTEGSGIAASLNIYRAYGPGVGDLNIMGCTASDGPYTFIAETGQTYYFQASGINGEVGSMQVNLQRIPSMGNDDFANATVIPSPLPFDDTVDTRLTTRETGEPTPSCAFYGTNSRSVWYAFTPTTSGTVAASIPSAGFTPVFAAYAGNSLSDLTEIGCQNYVGNYLLVSQANAGTTYYFQVGNLYPWESGSSMQFHLDIPPLPVADFYYFPSTPSVFDTIQFYDNSNDPGQLGFQSFIWDFGDGTTSTDQSPTHKYAADGNYTVQHSATTVDGRTASTSQVVQVGTHDVTLINVEAPEFTKVGKSEKITVSINNPTAYVETARVELYRSVSGGGFELVDTLTRTVPAFQKINKFTKYSFRYTFTASDADIGKVVFRAVVIIENATDAFPQDNEALSSRTFIRKR